jgi:putative ABC transport system substrate-binding protein
MKPDLVYAWGTPITLALVGEYDSKDPVRYVTTIPVVFVMVTYPVGSRIVQSMDGSQRNVTGATPTVPLESQIKAMQAYRPLRRLAVIYNGLEPNSVFNVRELKKLSAQMDFELVERRVPLDASGRPDASAIPQMVADLAVREPQFLYFGPDSFVGEHRDRIAEEAMRFGVPAFTATEFELMEGKALVGLIARYTSLGALAGYMAERILVHDVLPRDIPIQRLTRFTYGVRMSVARRLGIFPPMNVLDFAEIIDERGK